MKKIILIGVGLLVILVSILYYTRDFNKEKIKLDDKEVNLETSVIDVKEKSKVEVVENEIKEIDFSKINAENTLIKVYKELRTLELYSKDTKLKTYKIGLGSVAEGDKNIEGDLKTPEGQYYICTKNNKSRFTLFLGLSYPNIDDAKRGLDNGIIDESTFSKIKKQIEDVKQPLWNTPLGGAVGIHGGGNNSDWTLGCIALSDEDIKEIYRVVKIGTVVYIYK